MIVVFFVILSITCVFVGFLIASIQASESLERMRAELNNSIGLETVKRVLQDAAMPHTLSHSAAWNGALLDIAKRLGVDDAD